jgi:hypothetical protein
MREGLIHLNILASNSISSGAVPKNLWVGGWVLGPQGFQLSFHHHVGALPPTGSIKSIMTTDAAMLSLVLKNHLT